MILSTPRSIISNMPATQRNQVIIDLNCNTKAWINQSRGHYLFTVYNHALNMSIAYSLVINCRLNNEMREDINSEYFVPLM